MGNNSAKSTPLKPHSSLKDKQSKRLDTENTQNKNLPMFNTKNCIWYRASKIYV